MRSFLQREYSERLRAGFVVPLQRYVAAAISVLLLTDCGSIRLNGVVTDAKTRQPIPHCMVGVPGRYVQTDLQGRYSLTTRPWKDALEFSVAGYLPRTVKFTRTNRYPVVNAELQPESGLSADGARFDPYTGEPLTPRFDPYTGKPLQSRP
jgi:hypothetical protein